MIQFLSILTLSFCCCCCYFNNWILDGSWLMKNLYRTAVHSGVAKMFVLYVCFSFDLCATRYSLDFGNGSADRRSFIYSLIIMFESSLVWSWIGSCTSASAVLCHFLYFQMEGYKCLWPFMVKNIYLFYTSILLMFVFNKCVWSIVECCFWCK